VYQICNGLSLGQINLAVEEGAFGKFPGAGWSRACPNNGLKYHAANIEAAVATDFYDVFTGVGMRPSKDCDQN
jgi:hypothetical protein